jgi:hypothetical protein
VLPNENTLRDTSSTVILSGVKNLWPYPTLADLRDHSLSLGITIRNAIRLQFSSRPLIFCIALLTERTALKKEFVWLA